MEGVNLFFDEDGVEKKYFIPTYINDKNSDKYGKFHYLFEKFADIEEGEMLEIEYVKKGLTGFVDVRRLENKIPEYSDIPVINEDENNQGDTDEVKTDNIPF